MGEMTAIRDAYGAALKELGEQDVRIVGLEADVASSTKSGIFGSAFPERYFNVGISELNMVSMAAGLARTGFIPFVNTFAVFLTTRGADPVQSLIAYDSLNVKLCGAYCGLSDSYDGASHQAITDMAFVRSVPGMTVISTADAAETRMAVFAAAAHQGPVYLRFGRMAVPVFNDPQTYHFEMGKGITLRDGKDITIVATGLMVAEAIEAGKMLEEKGIDARIINIHTIKPLDEQLVCKAAQETGKIITVEEHSVIGGLGDAVCAAVNVGSNGCQVVKMGVHDVYGHSGPGGDLITEFGLRAANIVEEALKLL